MIIYALIAVISLVSSMTTVAPSLARSGAPPSSMTSDLTPLREIDRVVLPAIDVEQYMREDEEAATFEPGGPARFAVPITVDLTSYRDGTWERRHDGARIWRLRVLSPGALSLNFGFERFHLPPGATVHLYPSPEGVVTQSLEGWYSGPYSVHDADHEGGFWTAVIPGDETVVEMCVPSDSPFEPELRISQVAHDYRGFAQMTRAASKQGDCNIDVICPEGDPWRDEIRSVAVYSRNGQFACTGTLINSHDPTKPPYFLTAYHCGVTAQNVRTMVVYWNFESPSCGSLSGGSMNQHQTGAEFVARYAATDFCLVRLGEEPDSSFNVYYSGWDAREEAELLGAVAIHHPSCDEKAISFTNTPLSVTSYLLDSVPGDGTHWRVHFWDLGTTEPGSSGSGLWNTDRRLVGQLHGGYASCTSLTSDWYGRLSRSWEGGGSSATRLRDWLDPLGTGGLVIDGLDDPESGEGLTGDANQDGVVNIQDIVAAVNHILGVAPLSDQGLANADLDGDEVITIHDLVGVISIILDAPPRFDGLGYTAGMDSAGAHGHECLPSSNPLNSSGELPVIVSLVSEDDIETPGLLIAGGDDLAAIQILLDSGPRLSEDATDPVQQTDTRTAGIEGIEGSGWKGQAALEPCGSIKMVLYSLRRERGGSPGLVQLPFGLHPDNLVWISARAASSMGSELIVEPSGFADYPPDSSTDDAGQPNPMLLGVEPNPFREEISLRIFLPSSGPVAMGLYDVKGRLLAKRSAETLPAGVSLLGWRVGSAGSRDAGVYYIRVTCDGRTIGTQSVVLIR